MSGRFQWVWLISLTLPHRASMIWILGEYCDRIDEVEEILGSFLEGFQDESPQVLRTKKPSIHVHVLHYYLSSLRFSSSS